MASSSPNASRIRIAALNEESVSITTKESRTTETATREAQEEAAFALYNKALQLQRDGKPSDAESTLLELLRVSVVSDVVAAEADPDNVTSSKSGATTRLGAQLKYSAYKNLAAMAAKRGDNETAMEFYLEAVTLDSSDVTVWFHVGSLAVKIVNYPLAGLAFRECLKCSSSHWPSLDSLVTVLYVLNDYTSCLCYIAQALQMDSLYAKGLAIRDQIFREHPGLRRDTMHFFYDCDSRIYDSNAYDEAEGRRHVEEALEMRQLKREKCRPPPPVTLSFVKPLSEKSWRNLGDCLTDLYEVVSKSSKPRLSFGSLVNVSKYVRPVVDSTETADSAPPKDTDNQVTQNDKMEVESVTGEPVSTPTVDLAVSAVLTPDSAVLGTPDGEENQSLSDPTTGFDSGGGGANDSRKGRKRKLFPFELIDASAKRRSARVRNTVTKSETVIKPTEKVNFGDLLRKFLPSSLLSTGIDEEDVVTVIATTAVNSKSAEGDASTSNEEPSTSNTESKIVTKIEDPSPASDDVMDDDESSVCKFLESTIKNTGVLDLMYKFLLTVGERWRLRWPEALRETFTEVYGRVRDHITHPSLFGQQERDAEDVMWEGVVTLINCEFKMDRWLQAKTVAGGSTATGSGQFLRVPSPSFNPGPDFPGRHFNVDVDYLMQLTTRPDIFGDAHLELTLRVLWLKARFLMLQGETEYAVDCLERGLDMMSLEERRVKAPVKFCLINCKSDNEITQENLQKQLESLQQCQSLEDMHRLYQSGKFQQVVDLLAPTIRDHNHGGRKITNSSMVPDRQSQLLLLLDSLLHLGVAQDTLYWGELAFDESWRRYRTSSAGSGCTPLLVELLAKLERCVSGEPSSVHTLPAVALKRLIQNLIGMVVVQMETPESASEMPIDSVVPWILLFHIIHQEEQKIRSLVQKSVTPSATSCKEVAELSSEEEEEPKSSAPGGPFGDQEFGPGMPSSLMLLFSAHEYLGRRGWCTASDGAFLLLYANVAVEELRKSTYNSPHPFKDFLDASAEQCFFCLYGHPNRRAKAKQLKDHHVTPVALTWSRSEALFEYFKPRELPEFDSVKGQSISSEIEFLFKRVLALVPADEDPSPRVELLSAYVESSNDAFPRLEEEAEDGAEGVTKKNRHPITSELYYLLADYYFKNYEQSKAVKFYLMDLAVLPDHFDSWAGMALARSSLLEQKLNSCEFRNEAVIYGRADSVLRCFNRALVLQPAATALWIENGTMAYVLHSYSSRQLRQRDQNELGPDTIDFLRKKGAEMLRSAKVCFKSASMCEDIGEEEWLHHYMLGKAAEKRRRSPKVFLHHYKLAALYLHVENANYPRKIQYHNPPTYSLEALEVYFRTHAAILKYLVAQEGQPLDSETHKLISGYLKDAADGAFANFQEKRHSSNTGSDVDESNLLLEECRKLRRVNPLANDHDYFKRKRKSSGQEEGHGANPNAPSRNRPSIDSSSESQDSAAVKDILNAIVSVITEQMEEGKPAVGPEAVGAIVVGDTKIVRPPSQLDDSSTDDVPPRRLSRSRPENEDDVGLKNSEAKDRTAEGGSPLSDDAGSLDHRHLIGNCEEALLQCLGRFPQHYKSLYRLAHYYFTSKFHKDTQRSWDYLMGPSGAWQNCSYMTSQALFAERKNTNFFNGIWRIPIDEIDRTGSFSTHMFRSILLLMDIINERDDHNLMMHLTTQLHRNPDTGKKYLRDIDRLYLAKTTCEQSIAIVLRKMTQLVSEENPSSAQLMLDVHRAYLHLQKVVDDQDVINKFMEKAYRILMHDKVEGPQTVLDQAIRFCQQQQLISKSNQVTTPTSSDGTFKSVADSKQEDLQSESTAVVTQRDVNSSPGSGEWATEDKPDSSATHAKPSTSSQASSYQKQLLASYSVLSSPSRLTADVQSKIKSLDPVEPMGYFSQKMSGFQLEFLRQIGADRTPPKDSKVSPLGGRKKPASSAHGRASNKHAVAEVAKVEPRSTKDYASKDDAFLL